MMKKKILRILKIVLWSVLFSGTAVLLGFVNYENNGETCRRIAMSFDYGQSDILVHESDIDSLLADSYGRIVGSPLYSINTGKIEKIIRRQPYVENVAVYLNDDGILDIEITQRQPILRIITPTYMSYYLDGKGTPLPLNPNYPARVLVANGNIPDSVWSSTPKNLDSLVADTTCTGNVIAGLFRLAIYINNDPFFRSQIDQVYVDANGEFELIPKVGNHIILLGCAENLDEKFTKLFAFYKYGMKEIGWNKYNIINIKFKNQVICSKI